MILAVSVNCCLLSWSCCAKTDLSMEKGLKVLLTSSDSLSAFLYTRSWTHLSEEESSWLALSLLYNQVYIIKASNTQSDSNIVHKNVQMCYHGTFSMILVNYQSR